ncbi:peptide-methionine (S)-S-oxide reductase MsrA [Maribacter luteus]|uniref:Peptide methionine sulfoxide reductase MsrA n=1 Tax=Maribacter luteus TaxID=2594478 RepID=A0A6I2MQB5_9FLAO|nr:peptide-methionine (S)-S-oxide reductase MsrA [Maribacter luteus]MRX64424.1 peptide-methionine (S)-S-oxide reductase MsrA [Maribacter luteus]
MIKSILLTLTILFSTSCESNVKKSKQAHDPPNAQTISKPTPDNLQKYEVAYFASGCFWCVEAIYEDVIGVKEVISGYSGGSEKNPTYEQVGRGLTTHAEAVKVYYDPKVVDFKTLVVVFFGSHDPTTLNRQGPDHGAQYRSIAFYSNEEEKKIIENYIEQLKKDKVYNSPIVTQVEKFRKFYDAEDYHQDYEKLNPNNPYIINISIPRYKRFKAKYPELMKKGGH